MPKNPLIDLYLNLLKGVITNTLFQDEPDIDQESHAFVHDFIRHYINGPALSLLPQKRFDNIRTCIEDVIIRDVPGDLIETGVWRGGATIFMRAVLRAYNITDRRVWVADSFEGLPKPDPEKYPLEASVHNGVVMSNTYKHFAVDLGEVKRNFEAFGLLDENVRFLKGWFNETLPSAPIDKLSIIRLDGDYYESTMDALTFLYDKVSPGGYVIIDDYGEDSWTYCRLAVDEFRKSREIDEPMTQVDSKCHYWQRKLLER